MCGTAAREAATQVVPDVELFPGHIACDGLSRSEIVVPIVQAGKVRARFWFCLFPPWLTCFVDAVVLTRWRTGCGYH